ncbi:uncharacterized protein LOC128030159 [Carassius gibelio]|uniref:uncharacterized protein LOC128030159 n=1 Tax=Carassius gibelio TaxID=101364 RepID=UPI002277B510|nr:uncharacterized protein LOC128030159 [Carassius gibelio]
MTSAVLRIILGESSCQRVVFPSGLPESVTELEDAVRSQCKLQDPFRLQFMDTLFDNQFMNLTSMNEIKDKATIKIINITDSLSPLNATSAGTMNSSTFAPGHSEVSASISSFSSTRRSSWPETFCIPPFSYDAEFKLEQANSVFRENGTLLIPDIKLKSDILEGLVQKIVQYKVYVTDREFEQVGEALIKKHPCLTERGSDTGYGGWKVSLKYKLSNYRTHLRKLGCPEVTVNSLKHKPDGKKSPAYNVKKPKRGEVHYCPSYSPGENDHTLEIARVELLSDVKKNNNRETIKTKMQRTFALRRQEVLRCAPMIGDFMMRWPALFDVTEVNAEFKRITTVPLQSKFLSQLDLHYEGFLKVFERRPGQQGRKLKEMMSTVVEDDIDAARELAIRGLCIYLNEDPKDLIQEYVVSSYSLTDGICTMFNKKHITTSKNHGFIKYAHCNIN